MQIRIKKKSLFEILVYLQVVVPCLLRGLTVNFNFPVSITLMNYIILLGLYYITRNAYIIFYKI